ncbi:hypothetical protein [Streptomyces sp. NPDC093223]|uniref:hypothetical protein n=1 Tax=Streptomyces sp. NPDC093223 TaxID=3366033 RepID=UPI00381B2752
MSDQPWTIESIRDALGNPALAQRFIGEINRAPAHELMGVFAKWQGIAQRTLDAVNRGQEAAAAEAAGGEVPGEWQDVTERVLQEAERIRARGAA